MQRIFDADRVGFVEDAFNNFVGPGWAIRDDLLCGFPSVNRANRERFTEGCRAKASIWRFPEWSSGKCGIGIKRERNRVSK